MQNRVWVVLFFFFFLPEAHQINMDFIMQSKASDLLRNLQDVFSHLIKGVIQFFFII